MHYVDPQSRREEIQVPYSKRFLLAKHSSAKLVRNVIGKDMWDDYFKFAVVRNPFDRLVSAYHFYLKWNHRSTEAVKQFSGFEEFVFSDYFKEDARNSARPCGLQSSHLELEGSCAVDFTCKFENLVDDMNHVARTVGLSIPSLQRHNVSSRSDYKEYYNDRLIEYVASVYSADIEKFGYGI